MRDKSENNNNDYQVKTLANKHNKRKLTLDEMIEDFNRQVPTKKKVNKRRNNK